MSIFRFLPLLLLMACQAEKPESDPTKSDQTHSTREDLFSYYAKNQGNDAPSRSIGTVGKGSLVNGKLVPFEGPNFQYFDALSYLEGRAFVHHRVKKTLIDAYDQMSRLTPGRQFFIMECSNQKGGKIFPHRTHQNGLSVDFMLPKLKNGQPHYDLDSMGAAHYLLAFNDQGACTTHPSVSIDFEVVAQHLLALQESARKNGLAIKKVLLKIELKDELFATPSGQRLLNGGIRFATHLQPLINAVHDDHYHVDFELK